MKIQEIEFSRLIPADYNPRVALTPDMPEFERLKNSIETFGNVEPIVWNERTGHIVGGHQRLAVLQHLGYTSAEVSVVDLDEKEEKLLNVALNKIKGQWDYSRLEEIFQEYELEEAKFTGFTGQEIALILAKNDDLENDAEEYDDEPGDYVGASWVITLAFEHASDARSWAEENGHSGAVKNGASTTVIRME